MGSVAFILLRPILLQACEGVKSVEELELEPEQSADEMLVLCVLTAQCTANKVLSLDLESLCMRFA